MLRTFLAIVCVAASACSGAQLGGALSTARDAANRGGKVLSSVSSSTTDVGEGIDAVCALPQVAQSAQCIALEDRYADLYKRVSDCVDVYTEVQKAIDTVDQVTR